MKSYDPGGNDVFTENNAYSVRIPNQEYRIHSKQGIELQALFVPRATRSGAYVVYGPAVTPTGTLFFPSLAVRKPPGEFQLSFQTA